jgi:hypothetical protein
MGIHNPRSDESARKLEHLSPSTAGSFHLVVAPHGDNSVPCDAQGLGPGPPRISREDSGGKYRCLHGNSSETHLQTIEFLGILINRRGGSPYSILSKGTHPMKEPLGSAERLVGWVIFLLVVACRPLPENLELAPELLLDHLVWP